jgi:hypothetical protein
MSQLPTAYGLMGLGKSKKGNHERRIVTVGVVVKRMKRIFHLSTSRRAVYCRFALESRSVAHCGRLR